MCGDYPIRFLCHNTAWIVRRDIQQQGNMVFPILEEKYQGSRTFRLVVSVIHHPYNWFSDVNARKLRNEITESSNILLTGHEHGQDAFQIETYRQEVIQYLEGGVLQDSNNPKKSSFNAIVIDLESCKQKLVQFSWDKDIYRRKFVDDEDYTDFQLNRIRKTGHFEISDKYYKYLNDSGASLVHSEHGRLKLDETFIDLDLTQVTNFGADDSFDDINSQLKIKSSHLCIEAIATPLLFVSGIYKSGKTTLLKKIFMEFHQKGMVPIAISNEGLRRKRNRELLQKVKDSLSIQYEKSDFERFRQLDISKRVLLIDDFELNELNYETKEKILEEYSRYFGHIVVFVATTIPFLDELQYKDSFSNIKYYQIQQMGNELIEKTIQKWIQLGREDTVTNDQFLMKVDFSSNIVKSFIDNRIIPSQPIFILATLQLIQNNYIVETSITSYGQGYVLEQLVKESIRRVVKKDDLSGEEAYLSFVAYHMFSKKKVLVSENELLDIHLSYCERYAASHLRTKFQDYVDTFEQADIFLRVNGGIRFKYRYAFYYFVALYFKDRLLQVEIQNEIRGIAESLYVQSSVDVMLFLAHLSKEKLISEMLINVSSEQFKELSLSDLERDFNSFKVPLEDFPKLYYQETDPLIERQERAKKQDTLKVRNNDDDGFVTDDDFDDLRSESLIVPNSIKIMGQLLKNYPLALEGDVKYRLTEESYTLGLRLLSLVFLLLEERMVMLAADFIIKRQSDNEKSEREMSRLKNEFSTLNVSFAKQIMIRIIAFIGDAVFSNELNETYREMVKRHDTVGVKLIDSYIRLNQPVKDWKTIFLYQDEFKTSPLATSILREMVYSHLKMYKLRDRGQIQRVCDKFNISNLPQIKKI